MSSEDHTKCSLPSLELQIAPLPHVRQLFDVPKDRLRHCVEGHEIHDTPQDLSVWVVLLALEVLPLTHAKPSILDGTAGPRSQLAWVEYGAQADADKTLPP